MSDIGKCFGHGCPFKEYCYRFTAPESFWQSYFGEVPLKDGECEEYWGDPEKYKEIKDANKNILPNNK